MEDVREPYSSTDNSKDYNISIQKYFEIIDRAQKEVDRVSSAYKIAASCITFIIVAGGIAFYANVHDMRSEMRDNLKSETDFMKTNVELMKTKSSQEFLILSDSLKHGLERNVASFERKVEYRIDDQFNKENIKGLVEEKAKERIDKYADELINRQIQSDINPKIAATEGKIESLNAEVSKTLDKFNILNQDLEFIKIVSAAQNDDRMAFDQLRSWSDKENYPLHTKAAQAWLAIMNDADSAIRWGDLKVPWPENLEPSKLTINDLRTLYNSAPDWIKPALIQYVWKRDDIAKLDRLEFLIEVMKKDKSLRAVDQAGRFFRAENNLKIKTLAYPEMLDWWGKNKK
jgi:hypothetical protein